MIINSNGTGGGLSNAGASWAGGVVPVDGDKVNIVNGDTITLTGTHVWGDDTTTGINVKSGGMNASASTQYQLTDNFNVVIANKNVDPLLQEIYTNGGNFFRDNSVFKAGTASLRFDRIASAIKPAINQWYIFAPTGKAVCVTGYLRKNSSYGSSTLPYVTLTGLGITTSTFTMTDVNDTWVQFVVQGTQTTGTDGMLTLSVYFQSANVSASAWIDEISAVSSGAVNSGGLEYWANGQPAQIIASNYTAPIDVWNVLATQTTLTGSMGKKVNDIKNDTGLIHALL
jgi:hypothetical protein